MKNINYGHNLLKELTYVYRFLSKFKIYSNNTKSIIIKGDQQLINNNIRAPLLTMPLLFFWFFF